MDRLVDLRSGRLLWCGEHWINALRQGDSATPSAWVSLYHTRYSPAGEGNVAQVVIPQFSLDVVYTDNPDLVEWITREFFKSSSLYDPDAPILEARFAREGRTRLDPAWLIESENHHIIARWQVSDPPIIADGSFRTGTEHFTLLFFTNKATVEFDGRNIEGQPYLRDIWQATIGGLRSSCVFALAETLIETNEPTG